MVNVRTSLHDFVSDYVNAFFIEPRLIRNVRNIEHGGCCDLIYRLVDRHGLTGYFNGKTDQLCDIVSICDDHVWGMCCNILSHDYPQQKQKKFLLNLSLQRNWTNDVCCICLTELSKNISKIVFVPCGHVICHEKCWESYVNVKTDCPVCRKNIEEIITPFGVNWFNDDFFTPEFDNLYKNVMECVPLP